MLKDEIIDFLRKGMPFSFISSEELENLIDGITLDYYPKGTKIHTQGGPPSEYLGVIKKGAIKVYRISEENEITVIDYRGEGEQFGLLSLVSGDMTRTNIIAEEDTICYLIPKENVLSLLKNNPAANEYFLKTFFINFIDKTQEKTREKYSGLVNSDRLLFTTLVGEIVRRTPVTVSQDFSIQEAALVMVEQRISSLIVINESGQPVGMVTDRDLREKVVAGGADVRNPLSTIMSSSLVSVNADEYCFEALLQMIHHKIHHILVMDGETLKGIVTNHDFMTLQGSSPTGLVKEIEKIKDLAELKRITPNIFTTVSALLRDGAKAYNITGLITEIVEKIINSAADFFVKAEGPSPMPYSLFLYGEGGRRELSLDFQIKLGCVCADTNDPVMVERTKNYFKKFTDKLNNSLLAYLACNRPSIQLKHIKDYSGWKTFLQEEVAGTTTGPRAAFFEMRAIRGEGEAVEELRKLLWDTASANDDFMELIVLSTIQNRPPLGFFKQFVVEKDGEHKNELNIYQKGIKPLVDIIRIFSLKNGIGTLSSRGRLQELKNKSFEQARDVEHAYDYLNSLLLHNQFHQNEAGQRPDNFIDPGTLDGFEKNTLKSSFQLINALYEIIRSSQQTSWEIK